MEGSREGERNALHRDKALSVYVLGSRGVGNSGEPRRPSSFNEATLFTTVQIKRQSFNVPTSKETGKFAECTATPMELSRHN